MGLSSLTTRSATNDLSSKTSNPIQAIQWPRRTLLPTGWKQSTEQKKWPSPRVCKIPSPERTLSRFHHQHYLATQIRSTGEPTITPRDPLAHEGTSIPPGTPNLSRAVGDSASGLRRMALQLSFSLQSVTRLSIPLQQNIGAFLEVFADHWFMTYTAGRMFEECFCEHRCMTPTFMIFVRNMARRGPEHERFYGCIKEGRALVGCRAGSILWVACIWGEF